MRVFRFVLTRVSHSYGVTMCLTPWYPSSVCVLVWNLIMTYVRCRCVFSIGGDGTLNVLDDADAKGYIHPSAREGGARRPSPHHSICPLATGGGAAPDAYTEDGRAPPQSHGIGVERYTPSEDNEFGQGKQSKRTRKSCEGANSGTPDGNLARLGGRSVLLRQVAFSTSNSNGEDDVSSSEANSKSPTPPGANEESWIAATPGKQSKIRCIGEEHTSTRGVIEHESIHNLKKEQPNSMRA